MTREEIIEGLKCDAATYLFESCLNRFYNKKEYVHSQPKYEAIMQVLNGILVCKDKDAVISSYEVDAMACKLLGEWLDESNNRKDGDTHE